MAQVCPSLCACTARADSLVSQLATTFRLVSSRSVRRSLRHPSIPIISDAFGAVGTISAPPIVLDDSRRLLLTQLASWPSNSTWRVRLDVAVVLVASTAYTIVSPPSTTFLRSRILSTTFDASKSGRSNGPLAAYLDVVCPFRWRTRYWRSKDVYHRSGRRLAWRFRHSGRMGARELYVMSFPHPVPVCVCAQVLTRLTVSSARILRPHRSLTLPTRPFHLPGHLARRGLSKVSLLLQAFFNKF